jgi:hypothetical protein
MVMMTIDKVFSSVEAGVSIQFIPSFLLLAFPYDFEGINAIIINMQIMKHATLIPEGLPAQTLLLM